MQIDSGAKYSHHTHPQAFRHEPHCITTAFPECCYCFAAQMVVMIVADCKTRVRERRCSKQFSNGKDKETGTEARTQDKIDARKVIDR